MNFRIAAEHTIRWFSSPVDARLNDFGCLRKNFWTNPPSITVLAR